MNYVITQEQADALAVFAGGMRIYSARELSLEILRSLKPIAPLTEERIVDIGNEVHRAMPDNADEQEELIAIVREVESAITGSQS